MFNSYFSLPEGIFICSEDEVVSLLVSTYYPTSTGYPWSCWEIFTIQTNINTFIRFNAFKKKNKQTNKQTNKLILAQHLDITFWFAGK